MVNIIASYKCYLKFMMQHETMNELMIDGVPSFNRMLVMQLQRILFPTLVYVYNIYACFNER